MKIRFLSAERIILFLPTILALIFYFLPNNLEFYPRVGWVDAGMYTGYINNDNLVKDYGFVSHNYQGSRLGYIVPAKIFSTFFDAVSGRYLFVFFYYFATLIALISLIRNFSKKLDIQALFITAIICNPLLISGISYGGADGPAACYMIISAAFLFNSTHTRKTKFFLALAGMFAALSFSTHVLSLVSLGFIITGYFISQKENIQRKIIPIALGFSATIICLSLIGHYLGFERNYLMYSFGFGVQSVKGMGGNFARPLHDFLSYSLIYLPPFTLMCIGIVFSMRNTALANRLKNWNLLASVILSAGPLSFFILYDKLLKGAISQYFSYYELLYPCFILSFLFLLIDKNLDISQKVIVLINTVLFLLFVFAIYNLDIRYSLLLAASAATLIFLLTNQNSTYVKRIWTCSIFVLIISQQLIYANHGSVKPFLHSAGNANTEDLYRSELKFMSTINKLPRAYGLPLFIYESSKSENGLYEGQFYSTYFRGNKNIYTYLDSLTALYLWDRSILSTNPHSPNFKVEVEQSDHSRQIVILGRNNNELNDIYNRVKLENPAIQTITKECYQSNYYPWCIRVVREFINKGQE